jgi:hypothetical protein
MLPTTLCIRVLNSCLDYKNKRAKELAERRALEEQLARAAGGEGQRAKRPYVANRQNVGQVV